MEQRQGVIISISGRRGRGPGHITFDDGSELGTFDPELLKLAAANMKATVNYAWEEKVSKKNGETYKTLKSLEVVSKAETALEATIEGGLLSTPIQPEKVLTVTKPGPLVAHRSAIAELEEGFAMAVRQRELMEGFIKERFKEGIHFSDGRMFGSDRPVLLQPGAQLILYAHGYSIDPLVLAGPLEPPHDPNARYIVTIRTVVYNAAGRQIGAAIGSASSLIWSNKKGNFVSRAVDPDKTHNSTIKIAVKRSMVAVCRQTTAASEMFGEDIEEGGYGEEAKSAGSGRFIKP